MDYKPTQTSLLKFHLKFKARSKQLKQKIH